MPAVSVGIGSAFLYVTGDPVKTEVMTKKKCQKPYFTVHKVSKGKYRIEIQNLCCTFIFYSLLHTSHQSTSWHPTALISQTFTMVPAYFYRKDKRVHLGLPERSIFSVKIVVPITLIVCLIVNLYTLPVYL